MDEARKIGKKYQLLSALCLIGFIGCFFLFVITPFAIIGSITFIISMIPILELRGGLIAASLLKINFDNVPLVSADTTIKDAITTLANDLNAKAIIAPTITGHTAKVLSKFNMFFIFLH